MPPSAIWGTGSADKNKGVKSYLGSQWTICDHELFFFSVTFENQKYVNLFDELNHSNLIVNLIFSS